jgi:hypothetical protein
MRLGQFGTEDLRHHLPSLDALPQLRHHARNPAGDEWRHHHLAIGIRLDDAGQSQSHRRMTGADGCNRDPGARHRFRIERDHDIRQRGAGLRPRRGHCGTRA